MNKFSSNTLKDFRQRFVFDKQDARGCVVQLEQTLKEIHSNHDYPPALAKLLNEFALAAALLRDSVKFDGSLTIQLRTPGAVKLIVADCLADRSIRAIAEYDADSISQLQYWKLNKLGAGAVLAVTITPEEGERYQSIIPIENASLAECLEDYFERSEQLPSKFSLHASTRKGKGIGLHALPANKISDELQAQQEFDRLGILLDTLNSEEALSLDAETVLRRLFHEEHCRLFEAKQLQFGCECSAEKSLDAIVALGREDIDSLIAELEAEGRRSLMVDCQFCHKNFEFELSKLKTIFQ